MTESQTIMNQAHQDAMAYWQRLRKDKPSNLAIGGLVIGAVVTTISLIALVLPHSDGAMHNRGNPLYWLFMLPCVFWAWSLSTFSPRSVRTIRSAIIVLPTIGGLILFIVYNDNKDILGLSHESIVNLWMTIVAFFITLIGSLVSWFALQHSLLQAEGPDRRSMKPAEAARQAAMSGLRARVLKTSRSGQDQNTRKQRRVD
ncbi:MAG: hypothetical protein ACRYGI_08975 [Janthinobacterium lividum]